MKDKIKIYVWADKSWISEENVNDIDFYISSMGKSDDYATYLVPIKLDPEDIQELIDLNALPGMLPNTRVLGLKEMIKVPKGASVIIKHKKDINYNPITTLSDRIIITAPDIEITLVKPKE